VIKLKSFVYRFFLWIDIKVNHGMFEKLNWKNTPIFLRRLSNHYCNWVTFTLEDLLFPEERFIH